MTTDSSPRWSACWRMLDLECVGEDAFRGYSPPTAGPMVFGGQRSRRRWSRARRTVPADRPAHSLHGYFVLAGDPKTPIDYTVERVRDGKSFTTRRCTAKQRGSTIFSWRRRSRSRAGIRACVRAAGSSWPRNLGHDQRAIRAAKVVSAARRAGADGENSSLDIRFVDLEGMLGGAHRQDAPEYLVSHRRPDAGHYAVHQAVLAYLQT